MVLFIQLLKAGLIDNTMQHWVFSVFHKIKYISWTSIVKYSRWKKYVLWVAILGLRKQTISILNLLLREQWLSDESLPDVNAVGFIFPVNISIFCSAQYNQLIFVFHFLRTQARF